MPPYEAIVLLMCFVCYSECNKYFVYGGSEVPILFRKKLNINTFSKFSFFQDLEIITCICLLIQKKK